MASHYQAISSNKQKTWLIMVGFVGFITFLVYVMTQAFGYGLDMVGLALILSGSMSLGSYWFSDKIILSISGARPAKREEFFDYYTVTENLASGLRIPMPKLYVIEDSAMNAFATGRDPKHGVVVATTGLLNRLNRSEIEGVVAHELSHIQNYDIRLMSIVTILVGVISLLADWMLRMSFYGGGRRKKDDAGGQLQIIFIAVGLLLALLSPLIAQLIKLAVSRRREYLADASGVGITKNPQGLISALKKISADTEPLEAANKATAHLYISNPLKNLHSGVGWFSSLFLTHPPVEKRVAALSELVS